MVRFFVISFALLCASCSPKAIVAISEADAVYYLVRHAEKTTVKNDPGLTDEGHKRAQDLAARLSDVPLTKIYSSDYIRTRDTAAPAAKVKGLPVEIYDAGDLEALARALLTEEGYILVVGHSNTTPNVAALLGGDAGTDIVEATEYDRLYKITRDGEEVVSVIERFGEKSVY